MAEVTAYWRPDNLKQALALLERPGATIMGGGTEVNARRSGLSIEVVDLQALGLDRLQRLGPQTLLIGATTTLQQVADGDDVPACIREAARRERPSTLRSQATVGGCVMTRDPDSELQAALLIYDAVVGIAGRGGPDQVDLAALIADPSRWAGRIVTSLIVETSGVASSARAARTRADRPIVAAFARRTSDGKRRLALTGVAATPVLVQGVASLDPPGDFRGSKEYRSALAATLAGRVLEAIS